MILLGKHILRICFGYGMYNKPCLYISCFCPSQKSAECFLLLHNSIIMEKNIAHKFAFD